MNKAFLAILLSCALGLLLLNPAFAEDDFMLNVSSLSEYEEGEFLMVYGNITTLDKKPVSDVQIHVNFTSGTMDAITNSTGQFSIMPPVPLEVGEHIVTVYAKKGNKYANTKIAYDVIEFKAKETQVSEPVVEIIEKSDKKTELDPFSKMVMELEKQNPEEAKKETNSKEHAIDEKRKIAQDELEEDLKDSEKRHAFYSPQNAFYRFIEDVDSSVRGIFWQEFLFTENITKKAQDAKKKSLEMGKSSLEATKVFQEEAAVTRQEVIAFERKLSVIYGNSTAEIQGMFDEYGKLPRYD